MDKSSVGATILPAQEPEAVAWSLLADELWNAAGRGILGEFHEPMFAAVGGTAASIFMVNVYSWSALLNAGYLVQRGVHALDNVRHPQNWSGYIGLR